MAELLVLRHAKSAWDTGDVDFDRPLNARGSQAARKMGQWLRNNDLDPDRILSSSAERARRTAMEVVFACGVDRAHVDFEDELYHAHAENWLSILRQQHASRVLICGHNPGLDDLVEYLSAEMPPLSSTGKLMTTAAIAHFDLDGGWADLGRGSCRLVQLVRPRDV